MAFTTVTGSNGVTSLVGTTGVDVATIVTLESSVFVGGNTGDDALTLNLATAGRVNSEYNVRMGGGDDSFTLFNPLLNSFISLDGETLANDGNDTFNGFGSLIVGSELVGRGGNDVFNGLSLNGSVVNGNTGDDTINLFSSAASSVYGGQGTDIINTVNGFDSSSVLINGNKGSDTITLGFGGFTSGSVYGGNGNDTISAFLVRAAGGAVLATTAAGVFLSGDLGDDNIVGSDGFDDIEGGDGADVLNGGSGADAIDGGAGNDAITGGTEGDLIAGGSGNDRFIVAIGDSVVSAASPSFGFDSITDFVANTGTAAGNTINGDRIQFTVFAGLSYQQNANFASAGTSLLDDLFTSEFFGGGFNAGDNDVFGVTITGAVAWAGNYIVSDTNADGAVTVADNIVKLNTLSGIVANTFIG